MLCVKKTHEKTERHEPPSCRKRLAYSKALIGLSRVGPRVRTSESMTAQRIRRLLKEIVGVSAAAVDASLSYRGRVEAGYYSSH